MKKQNNKIILSIVSTFLLINMTFAKEVTSIDSITVTAQKIEENIQEVPISITVFDEFSIIDNNIKSVKDIAQYTPNLLLSNMGDTGILNPSIRGLNSDPSAVSTTVSMYIDGVPNFISTGYDSIINDIERIEILKGPQGTLYGKSAEAGVINIITKQPNNELRRSIGVEIGSDNKREYSLNFSGPIIEDNLYIGLSAKMYEKDGYLKNTHLNTIDNNRKHKFGKINLRYTPTDNLDISLISSRFQRDDGTTSVNTPTAYNTREIQSDLRGSIKSKTIAHSLKIKYDINNYKFESITTYKEDNDLRINDNDFSPLVISHTDVNMLYKNKAQEFRLSSNIDNLNWLVGVYMDKSDKTGGYKLESTTYPTSFTGTFNSTLDDKSLGIFAHLNYKVNNKLSLIGGIRYDKDKKSIDHKRFDIQLEDTFSEVSPKLALEYKISQNIMTYATIAKGYKSGGFYMHAPLGKQAYDKETLWNYEIGFKSSALDNKLILNSSIYYMDISDIQVLTSLNAFSAYLSNAASATSKGFEIEANYEVIDNLSLFAALGYNKTTFDNSGSYSGNYNPYAPKYNYSIGTKYRTDNGYFGKVNINGYGKMFLDKENIYEKKAYTLLNAKIGYETENFDIYLYGKNILDKRHDTIGCCSGTMAMLSDPREIGLQLSYRF